MLQRVFLLPRSLQRKTELVSRWQTECPPQKWCDENLNDNLAAERISGYREDGSFTARAKPQRLTWLHGYLVEDFFHAVFGKNFRHKIRITGRHTTRKQKDIAVEVRRDGTRDLLAIVYDV